MVYDVPGKFEPHIIISTINIFEFHWTLININSGYTFTFNASCTCIDYRAAVLYIE